MIRLRIAIFRIFFMVFVLYLCFLLFDTESEVCFVETSYYYLPCLVDPPPPLDEPPLDEVPLLDELLLDDDLETLELVPDELLLPDGGLETFAGRVFPDDCLDAGLLNSPLDLDEGVVAGW